jgi:hypothetical protein
MKQRYILALLLLCLGIWVLVGVANWAFPKGEEVYSQEGKESMLIYKESSPSTNPSWVRFFQDYTGVLLGVSLVAGLAGFGVLLANRGLLG